jgi:hypothetical protein
VTGSGLNQPRAGLGVDGTTRYLAVPSGNGWRSDSLRAGQIGRVVNELFKFVAAGSELVELNGVHRSDLACQVVRTPPLPVITCLDLTEAAMQLIAVVRVRELED